MNESNGWGDEPASMAAVTFILAAILFLLMGLALWWALS